MEYLYLVWAFIKKAVSFLTAPARIAVGFVSAHPKSAIAIWAASLYVALRFF